MHPKWASRSAWVMAVLFLLDALVGFVWCPQTKTDKSVRFLVVLASVVTFAVCDSNADECAA
jgi:hypothetical protein